MITIVAEPGQDITALTRHLVALAGHDSTAVRTGRGGLIVTDELAYAYLTTRLHGHPQAVTPPAGQVASPALTNHVRGAEYAAGVGPLPGTRPAKAPASNGSARSRGPRTAAAAGLVAAHTEEHS